MTGAGDSNFEPVAFRRRFFSKLCSHVTDRRHAVADLAVALPVELRLNRRYYQRRAFAVSASMIPNSVLSGMYSHPSAIQLRRQTRPLQQVNVDSIRLDASRGMIPVGHYDRITEP